MACFAWVNTLLSNLKTAITGTYHGFKFEKYAHRYLADAQYRFNHRFDLSTTSVTSYSARHSFTAWSLIVGINPLKLVKLMGYASKQMVYEVYGNYVEGLEEDAEKIIDYVGRDFVLGQKSKSPVPYGYSTGDSLERFAITS